MQSAARKTSLFIISLAIALFGCSPVSAIAEQLPVKTYTTADGLPRNQINRIVRDSRGFLWFCTEEGLSRFDGYKFTNYSAAQGLPSRQVLNLLETRAGVYWVANGETLCRLNPDGVPQPFAPRNNKDSITANPLFIVYQDSQTGGPTALFEDHAGTVWVGSWRGLFRLEQSGEQVSFHFVDLGMPSKSVDDQHVMAIAEDKQGTLWIGSQSSGIYSYSGGRVQRFTVADGLPSNAVHSLMMDREGTLWVGTVNGLCLINPNPASNQQVVSQVYTERDGLPNGWVSSLLQTSDGRLWVGSNGLMEFTRDSTGNRHNVRLYNQRNGINGQEVTALAEDRDGNLWLGTNSAGVIKLARNGFTTFSRADGLSERGVSSIFEDLSGGLRIISAEKGGSIIQGFSQRGLIKVRPRYPSSITAAGWGWNQFGFQDERGEWWIPTADGLCRFPGSTRFDQLDRVLPKAIYTINDGLTDNQVFRIFEDSHHDIWISTVSPRGNALARWERETETIQNISEKSEFAEANLSSIFVTSFAEDAAGNIWIGHQIGVIRYANGRFSFFGNSVGVPPGWIRAIYQDHAGRIWIASGQGGLSRIDDSQAEVPRFITYTTSEGLSSDQVNCITEDQWGRIYAGTGRGVDRLEPATGHIRHYTDNDGLIAGEVITTFRDRQNILWFGGLQGLSRFVPAPDVAESPPPVVISSLKIGGETQRISALGKLEIPMVELEAGRNQVQIEFLGLSFGTGETLRYEYKLEGSDKDWSTPSDQRSVNYASLAPGTYRFLVRAITSDGIFSESPASFSFRILPPIWQRSWFIALVALFIGLMIYATFRYRLAQLIKIERVRTSIASDLHDDIGSNLSVIAGLSDGLQRQSSGATVSSNDQLALIAAVSQRSLEAISDIVWAVNPKKDHLQDLTRRMRLFADEAFAAHDIKLCFSVADAASHARVGAEARRESFLIFKEAVNNIIRHSGCTIVETRIGTDHRALFFEVRDDGRGFDPEKATGGEGLASMRRRAEKINAVLDVVSSEGEGTMIRLRAPLR